MMVTLELLYEQICKSCRETRQATEPEHLDDIDNVCCKPNRVCRTNSHQHMGLVNDCIIHFSRDLASCSFAVAKKDCIFTYSNMA